MTKAELAEHTKQTQVSPDSYRALVLNAAWQPIETISWQHAFTKILNGRAKAVDHYDAVVRTPNQEFFIPAVLVLTEYSEIPKRTVVYSKRLVYIRDKYTCQYCRVKLTSSNATIDHVRPRSRGGRSNFKNCVASCESCNKIKSNRLLNQTNLRLLKQPNKPYVHPLHGKIKSIRDEWRPYLGKVFEKQMGV